MYRILKYYTGYAFIESDAMFLEKRYLETFMSFVFHLTHMNLSFLVIETQDNIVLTPFFRNRLFSKSPFLKGFKKNIMHSLSYKKY